MLPKVAVIVLNYNRGDDTLECLASLSQLSYPNFEIIVVDNASSDKSFLAQIRVQYPNAVILENTENLGYAGGNNSGIRLGLSRGADFIFILNNDTVIDPSCVTLLVQAAQSHPQATILAPMVTYYDRRHLINSFGTSMNWFTLKPHQGAYHQEDKGQFPSTLTAEIIPGAALLMPRHFFEIVGFFNEDLFLIHEDADLCFRNLKHGFQNLLVSQARVFHKVSKTLSSYPFLTAYYSARNFLFLVRQHANPLQKISSMAGLMLLIMKQTCFYLTADSSAQKKTRGFFSGVWDFCRGKMGRKN